MTGEGEANSCNVLDEYTQTLELSSEITEESCDFIPMFPLKTQMV